MTAHNATRPDQDPDERSGPPTVLPSGVQRSAGRRAVTWLRWHMLELTMVTVPLAAAVTVHAWIAAVSGVAAVNWARHEIQLARQTRAGRPDNLVTSNNDGDVTGKGRDHD